MDPDSLVDRLLYFLAEQGFVTGPDTGSDSYSVSQTQGDTLRLSPRLVVTEDVLSEYIAGWQAASAARTGLATRRCRS